MLWRQALFIDRETNFYWFFAERTTIFSFAMFTSISRLHRGQNSGNFMSTVDDKTFVRVRA